ncbi:MAG: ABC transporter permease [Thermoanaerobaculia bacterium]
MSRFLVRRTATALIVVVAVMTINFFALHLAPGDPTTVYLDARMSPAQQDQLRRSLGLDRPLLEQYLRWVGAIVLRGDLGDSFGHNRPVAWVLADHLPPTLLLLTTALLVQFVAGIGLGVLAARREGSWVDALVRWLSLALYSTPHFWLALMALLALSYNLGWFPAGHMISVDAADWSQPRQWLDRLHHLALPALALGLALAGGVARFVRNSFVEVYQEPFIRSSRAAGVPEGRILWPLGLKNALVPVIQLAGLSLPYLMSGALVTEVIFSWPGMGRLTFNAVQGRDYPLVLGAALLTAVLVVVGNLLADVGHAAVDPRVRRAITNATS